MFRICLRNLKHSSCRWLPRSTDHSVDDRGQVQRLGGGRECNIFVPILGGNRTKIAPIVNIFDQHPGQMR